MVQVVWRQEGMKRVVRGELGRRRFGGRVFE
jgi:hypothetical protein